MPKVKTNSAAKKRFTFTGTGKIKRRHAYKESILAAIKPLLRSQNCGIRFEDEVIELGGRTFLKTTLYFFNDKGETITTSAIAEHTATKTGMDAAQITGAASKSPQFSLKLKKWR